ncbi:MAG: (Fe-S)-binding protein [Dehalococcoidia bacterium]
MTATHEHRKTGDHVHILDADLAQCVHCGFCLQACPTYVVTGLETESPRGRIQLAKALVEDRIEITPKVAAHFDLCLQCRACETACPSGVPYGRIIEGARAMVQESEARPASWGFRTRVMRLMLAAPWRPRVAFGLLRFYQRSPIAPIARKLLPHRLRDMERMLPKLPRHRYNPPEVAAVPVGAPKATVAMLNGCIMPLTHPQTHEASARVMARNGLKVLVPAAQGCCGALHAHNGDPDAARSLARKNIDVFLKSGAEYIAVDSAGCGSTMKEYPNLFRDEPAMLEKAQRFAAKVRDVTELLVETGFEAPKGQVDAVVTYQDSCHLAHAQQIKLPPRQILRSIPGLTLHEMQAPDRCCGSAGIYNMTQPVMSQRLLADKMDDVMQTGCGVIATANPGCMLQLDLGVRLRDGTQEVVHVVELLDRAYQAEDSAPAS